MRISKKPIANWPGNYIRTSNPTIKKPTKNFNRSMRPMKYSAIPGKEKSTISTAKTGKMRTSLNRRDSLEPAQDSVAGLKMYFQILETDNILISLNRCLDRAHAIQNSADRIIRQSYICPCAMQQKHMHRL